MHRDASASPFAEPTFGRNSWTEVFKPEGYAGDSVDGFFLIDSFFYMKKNNGKQDRYKQRLLAEIHRETGLFVSLLVVAARPSSTRRTAQLIFTSCPMKSMVASVF